METKNHKTEEKEMKVENKTVVLSEVEVNELRFMLANLNSPSREEAMQIADAWRTRLTVASRKMHPQAERGCVL